MDAVETQAAQWVLQRDRAEFTAEQRAALERWLAEDGRHREAYLKLDEIWCLSGSLRNYRPANGRFDRDVLGSVRPPRGKFRHRSPRFLSAFQPIMLATGMLMLIALLASTYWVLRIPGERYVTAVGGYQRVLLEDGSVIQLNTDTRLHVHYTPERREIYLDRGEAYFEVAHNFARPFVVDAESRRVVAVGTQFSVRREADDIRVSVTDGTVRLEGNGGLTPAIAPKEQLLPAGSIAVASTLGAVHVARTAVSEVEQHLSWRSGLLIFKNQSLAEIVTEINRYNLRQLRIADPELAAVTIGGNFKPNDLESFLAALHTLNIQTTQSGNTIEVYRP
jgi:transmembrane sensor